MTRFFLMTKYDKRLFICYFTSHIYILSSLTPGYLFYYNSTLFPPFLYKFYKIETNNKSDNKLDSVPCRDRNDPGVSVCFPLSVLSALFYFHSNQTFKIRRKNFIKRGTESSKRNKNISYSKRFL